MKIFCLITCLFLIGCGDNGNGNGGSAGSCGSEAGCVDYTGSQWTASSAEDICTTVPNSTYSSSACPTENLVGSCAVNQGGPGEFITRYYSPEFDATAAETACNINQGVFIP